MRLRTQRRVVYAAMGLTVLALTGGYALAAGLGVGATSSVQQGSQTTTVSSVTGLSYVSTSLFELSAAQSAASCTTSSTACDVSTAASTSCVGGLAGSTTCAQNDWVEQVSLSTQATTAFTGHAGGAANTIEITVYVVGAGGTTAGTTLYYIQASTTNAAEPIVQDFDVGTSATGPAAVTTVTVVASG